MLDAPPQKKTRNAVQTRARILAAAQDAFAKYGYAGVGIREIAKNAGVASSLLLRYFGSKAELFEEALVNAFYARGLFVRDRETFGRQMAELMLTEGDAPMIPMIVLANGDPAAREITRKLARRHMVEALAEWLGPPHAEARALDMLALMTGFFIQVHQLGATVPPETADWLARQLQALVDGD
jgi:AcrR family transcriptional regulator